MDSTEMCDLSWLNVTDGSQFCVDLLSDDNMMEYVKLQDTSFKTMQPSSRIIKPNLFRVTMHFRTMV